MVDMKRILIVGAYGYFGNHLDGQTVKTRNVHKLVEERFGGKVSGFDTLKVRRNPLLLFVLLWQLGRCNTLVLVPCLNNLTYVFPITYYLSKIFRYDIIEICIGGWQVEYFKGNERFKPHKLPMDLSKKIKVILPEMKDVDRRLKSELGFKNSEYFPNFRFFDPDMPLDRNRSNEFRLVFMARVNKKKGYDTIFEFANHIRGLFNDIKIDFFGPIENDDREEFMSLVDSNRYIVSYKGVLQPENIHKTLCMYDLMLFPTTYYTEGFPGSILDAYISGIPVIATEWMHSHEFIDDGHTGYIVPFGNCQEEFERRILELYRDREKLYCMKQAAHEKCKSYSADAAWNVLSKYL